MTTQTQAPKGQTMNFGIHRRGVAIPGAKVTVTIEGVAEALADLDALVIHLGDPDARTYHLEKSGKGSVLSFELVDGRPQAGRPI